MLGKVTTVGYKPSRALMGDFTVRSHTNRLQKKPESILLALVYSSCTHSTDI